MITLTPRDANVLLGIGAIVVLVLVYKKHPNVTSGSDTVRADMANYGQMYQVRQHAIHASPDARGPGVSSMMFYPGVLENSYFANLAWLPQPKQML
jgi:hypothetical protein